MKYMLEWRAGATAEIDVRMPREGDSSFRFRYNPAYRSTLRSPIGVLQVGPNSLLRSQQRLREFASSLQLVRGRGPGGEDGDARAASATTLQQIGRDLYELVLPRHVQADLRTPLFIELAVDEAMLALPWELMFDGRDFLGQKHAIGRYVNLHEPLLTQVVSPRGVGRELGDLKVLVIGVSRPSAEANVDELPAVEPEVEAITATLTGLGINPTVLLGRDADYDSVTAELRKEYHIIHYSGHATFDDSAPNRSALLLFDGRIETGAVMAFFSRHPAILCFINGCESTRTASEDEVDQDDEEDGRSWERRYNNYGLARAFLETGTYLLGSRWRVEDGSAGVFAATFYEAALGQGEPIGRAVALARAETAEQSPPESCTWASYVYYGDPRVTFRPQARVREPSRGAERTPAEEIEHLTEAYETAGAEQPLGSSRTPEMMRMLDQAARIAGAVDLAAVRDLFNRSEGGRIVALTVLNERSDPSSFDLLMESIVKPTSSFEQFVALEAMKSLTPLLDGQQAGEVRDAIAELSGEEDFFGTERYVVAHQIATQLAGASPPVLA